MVYCVYGDDSVFVRGWGCVVLFKVVDLMVLCVMSVECIFVVLCGVIL